MMCLGDASVRCVLGWCCVFVTMLPDTIDDSSTSYKEDTIDVSSTSIRNFKGLFYLNLGYSYSSFFYFGNVKSFLLPSRKTHIFLGDKQQTPGGERGESSGVSKVFLRIPRKSILFEQKT